MHSARLIAIVINVVGNIRVISYPNLLRPTFLYSYTRDLGTSLGYAITRRDLTVLLTLIAP